MTSRFIIGTSTNGWTSSDCDYLCDGVDDQVEINAAINALPSTGGEIVILDGTYSVSNTITLSKPAVTLTGSSWGTVLQRNTSAFTSGPMIDIPSGSDGCVVSNLKIDGQENGAVDGLNYGVRIGSSNNLVERVFMINVKNAGFRVWGDTTDYYAVHSNTSKGNVFVDCGSGFAVAYSAFCCSMYDTCVGSMATSLDLFHAPYGTISTAYVSDCRRTATDGGSIWIRGSSYGSKVTDNVVRNSAGTGIDVRLYVTSADLREVIVSRNQVYDSGAYGIAVASAPKTIVESNVSMRGAGASTDYTSTQHTIYVTQSPKCNIINNMILGKNYTNYTGNTNSVFSNNIY